MTAYPKGKDVMRRFVDRVSDMIADDLNRTFDAAVAIEQELGLRPAGKMGSIFGRLFTRGNLSKKDGKWRRQYWRPINNLNSAVFDDEKGHHRLGFSSNRFVGVKTEFGEDTPAVFVQLLATGANYAGWPWNLVLSVVKDDHVRVWGRDALGNRLSTQNFRRDTRIGMLVWGMI